MGRFVGKNSRVLDLPPPEHTRASRVVIDAFLKKTGAHLWIQHDFNGNAKLRKSLKFYE